MAYPNIYSDHIVDAPLGPRQEEVLSWLQGRRPVGETVELRIEDIRRDLGFQFREMVYRCLARLTVKGFIERVSYGDRGDKGSVRVTRRLEDIR